MIHLTISNLATHFVDDIAMRIPLPLWPGFYLFAVSWFTCGAVCLFSLFLSVGSLICCLKYESSLFSICWWCDLWCFGLSWFVFCTCDVLLFWGFMLALITYCMRSSLLWWEAADSLYRLSISPFDFSTFPHPWLPTTFSDAVLMRSVLVCVISINSLHALEP